MLAQSNGPRPTFWSPQKIFFLAWSWPFKQKNRGKKKKKKRKYTHPQTCLPSAAGSQQTRWSLTNSNTLRAPEKQGWTLSVVLKRLAAAAVRGIHSPLAPTSPGALPPSPCSPPPLNIWIIFSIALSGFVSANLKHFCPHNSWTTKHKDLKNVQLQYSSTLPLGDHCILQVCNFLPTTPLWWKWGERVQRLPLSVVPSFWGRGVLYSTAIGSFHPPSPFSPLPPPRHLPPPPPAGCLACAWRSETVAVLAAVCLFLTVCLSFCLLHPPPLVPSPTACWLSLGWGL